MLDLTAVTSDGVMVGAAGDCAGENREWVVRGHGRRDADADGVAGAAVDAEDDAAHARALALVQVPHLPPCVPLHLPLFLHLTLLHTGKREGPLEEESSPATNCRSAAEEMGDSGLRLVVTVNRQMLLNTDCTGFWLHVWRCCNVFL